MTVDFHSFGRPSLPDFGLFEYAELLSRDNPCFAEDDLFVYLAGLRPAMSDADRAEVISKYIMDELGFEPMTAEYNAAAREMCGIVDPHA